MSEGQVIEWKESWRDDWLRWICGFANAEGGTLVLGRNDRGEPVGVENAARLLEEIPNKVRDLLGIVVVVQLREEQGRELLEIVVEPYPTPISYRGEYHFPRSRRTRTSRARSSAPASSRPGGEASRRSSRPASARGSPRPCLSTTARACGSSSPMRRSTFGRPAQS